jgi:hypothetical protein
MPPEWMDGRLLPPISTGEPAGLARERLRRWCELRTLRDQRLALAAGRPMSGRQLRRLWMRRLNRCGFGNGI